MIKVTQGESMETLSANSENATSFAGVFQEPEQRISPQVECK
jgi:hypothetical protein